MRRQQGAAFAPTNAPLKFEEEMDAVDSSIVHFFHFHAIINCLTELKQYL